MMKNKTLLSLIIILISYSGWSQSSSRWNYHKLYDYGGSITSLKDNYCNQVVPPNNSSRVITVNLNSILLQKGKVYKTDIGFGQKYYYIAVANTGYFDSDENIENPSFGNPINVDCNSISEKYHKVRLVGKTKEEANSNDCAGSYASNYFDKLNILIGKPLDKGKIYQMNFGKGFYYYRIILAAYTKGDSDYDMNSSSVGNILNRFCDSDGDGVSDDNDNCPNEPGPSSNNGCPIQLQKPNLTFKRFRIMDGNTALLDFPNGNQNAPTLKKGKTYDFKVEVVNNQSNSSTASPVSLELLMSTSTSVFYPDPSAPIYGVETDADIGSISANNTKEKTFKVKIGDKIGSSPNLSNGSAYYFYLDIDINGNIDESNEEDNILRIGFYYSSTRSNNISPISLIKVTNTKKQKKFEVFVFNISGVLVTQKTVATKEEEHAFVQNLPKGFYIIKNDIKTYKVAK